MELNDFARRNSKEIQTVLTIAGSDSGGCAGIQADLRTFCALGLHGITVITAVTAQNTVEVTDTQIISPATTLHQLEAVLSDIGVQAVKTGMLPTPEIIEVVIDAVEKYRLSNLVVDPVVLSTSGARLIDEKALNNLTARLIPLAKVVTPNLKEAELLTGISVKSQSDMKEAARILIGRGAASAVIKGGHSSDPEKAVDVFFDGRSFEFLESRRIETQNTHGGGCSFSAAIAANLAKGSDLPDAVIQSKEFIARAIAHSYSIGKGPGPLGHFSHWRTRLAD